MAYVGYKATITINGEVIDENTEERDVMERMIRVDRV